jgi:hypothetical protein
MFLDDPYCSDIERLGWEHVALGSTNTYEVWIKLVKPHRGTTPQTELQIFTNTIKHH